MPGLLKAFRPAAFDATMTCGFPIENIALRRPTLLSQRPAHIFVTQNGDWPAQLRTKESRLFSCDGLVCTNPVYFERNRDRWTSALIPNGVDVARFSPGPQARQRLGLPLGRPIVLMVSALIASKRIEQAIRAVARLDGAVLVVAGDGPLRSHLSDFGNQSLGDRYVQRTFAHVDMPDLYRSVDVLVHTTLIESFGNIYVEAMASGVPLVAHASPATEWITESSHGLVDTEVTSQLAGALEEAIRGGRGITEEHRVQVVNERFTWPIVVKQYSNFLESTAATRG
ncbi:MAG: glycosyltransferase family 4 protein [Ilumatobacteraceae bacterium]|nr:glycosyltransferase family 4 protein [Ilumatobacteraceae bacterium]